MTERATPFDSLKPLAGRTLEAALNRALSLDPEIRDGLRALDGRSVALQPATACRSGRCSPTGSLIFRSAARSAA
jgi:hypothetical protein